MIDDQMTHHDPDGTEIDLQSQEWKDYVTERERISKLSDRELLQATYMMAWSTAKWQQQFVATIEDVKRQFAGHPLLSMLNQ